MDAAEAESTRNADIVGATIIRSQLGGLAQVDFDTVIIDEASQIPVPLGLLGMVNAKKWVVVGDHNQLQPVMKTVQSSDGSPPADTSIFSFLQNRYGTQRWLRQHYRSHADIIGFAQEAIYDDEIEVALSCPRRTNWDVDSIPDTRAAAVADGPPVVFVDVEGQQKWLKRFGSPINGEEIDTVTEVVEAFIDGGNHPESELGVITPYRAQRSLIGDEITNYGDVEVSTVDGFQGRERSTIVFSTVDTEPSGLELSGNENRFNVASTRPKDQFVMVGNRTAIEEHASWGSPLRRFIRYASSTGGVFDWDSGEWVDGVDLDGPVPVEPDAETDLSEDFDVTQQGTV